MIDPILGIDLGTTNSVVAVADDDGEVRVLCDQYGKKIQPSVVSFHPNGSVIVGAEARARRTIDAANTVYSAKRLIGQTFDYAQMAAATARVSYQLRQGPNNQPVVVTRAGELGVAEISAIVLDHMRKLARRALGVDLDRAVITVPANFSDAQRAATATAGAIAGITVPRVLNEPTAAALAYGHKRELDQLIAVYDFGGGTFDVSVVRLDRDVYEVLGTAGDSFLGGDDIDERVVAIMVEHFLREERIDLRGDSVAMQRLREAAEQLKLDLSEDNWATVQVDEIAYGAGGSPIDFHFDMARADLEKHAADIVDQTFPVCEEAVRVAGLGIADIQDVVLVGGSTKMPYVRERVADFFGKEPRTDVNPDEAVAMGAALQGLALRHILGPSPTAPRARSVEAALVERETQREKSTDAYPVVGNKPAGPAALARIELRRAPAPRTQEAPQNRSFADNPDEPTFVPGARQPDVITGISRASGEIKLPAVSPGRGLGRPIEPEVPVELDLSEMTVDGSSDMTGDVTGDMTGAIELPTTRLPAARPGLDSLFDSVDMDEEVDVDEDEDTAGPTRDFEQMDTRRAHRGDFAEVDTSAATGGFAEVDTGAFTPLIELAGADERGIDLDLSPLERAPSPRRGQAGVVDATTTRLPAQRLVAGHAVPSVIDVTPYSLGVATVAGFCEELIRRNARVPTQIKRVFSTSKDRQETVRIQIVQGESRRLHDNVILGDLVLDGLQPRPRGETEIEVIFQIDASGILRVRARDCQTGLEQQASLDITGRASTEELEAAVQRLRQMRG